jgi:hypothetical protein
MKKLGRYFKTNRREIVCDYGKYVGAILIKWRAHIKFGFCNHNFIVLIVLIVIVIKSKRFSCWRLRRKICGSLRDCVLKCRVCSCVLFCDPLRKIFFHI